MSFLPFLVMGCVQRPELAAATPTPMPNTMEIVINQNGDIPPGGVSSGGIQIHHVSHHHVTKQITYDFGSEVGTNSVCFWDTQSPQKKYCWSNTGSATISINRSGIIQNASFGGVGIPFQNVDANVKKEAYSGTGSYCFWITLNTIYCF